VLLGQTAAPCSLRHAQCQNRRIIAAILLTSHSYGCRAPPAAGQASWDAVVGMLVPAASHPHC
jgi:hypothetical protein